jgi:hypothetical protein
VIGTKRAQNCLRCWPNADEILSSTEYRGYAAECLRLANAMEREEDRARLLGMAEAWRELAEKLETQASKRSEGQDWSAGAECGCLL